ncbi:MAG: serine protease [Myxococcota bacterium]|nr:serine protease [Myxococcota bacterium]
MAETGAVAHAADLQVTDLMLMKLQFEALAANSRSKLEKETAVFNAQRAERQAELAATLRGRPKIAGINSQKAAPDQFPYQVALLHSGFWDRRRAQFCGGSLLNERWVLTAAHCFRKNTQPGDVEVLFGTTRISTGGAVAKVAKIIRHTSFKNVVLGHDIALVKLSEPVKPPGTVRLPDPSSAGLANALAVVSGWGDTFEGSRQGSDDLLYVRVPTVGREACRQAYEGEISEDVLCAGDEEGDACQGDSGGPLVLQGPEGPIQSGIVSWGDGCAREKVFGVYTSVAHYKQWIAEHLK